MLPRISKLGLKLTLAIGAILVVFMALDLLTSLHNTRNTSLKEIERWSILLAETVRVSMNTLMKEERMAARFEMFDAIRLEIPGLEKVRVIRGQRVNDIFRAVHEQRDIPIEQEAVADYRKRIAELSGDLKRTTDPLERQDVEAGIKEAREGIAEAEKKIAELRDVKSDPREMPVTEQDHQVLNSGKPIFLAEGDTLRVWAPYIARKNCGGASGCHFGVKDGEVLGAVHMQFSLAQINRDLVKDAILAAIGKMILGLVIIGSLIYMIHVVVIRNIHVIHGALRKFSGGDLSGRIVVSGKDEVQDLAQGINFFIDRFCEMLDQVKQEKRSAQENEERLKVVIDNAGEAIITIDERGVVQSFNDAAETIFGYGEKEAVGRNISELVPGLIERGSGMRDVTGKRKDGKEFPAEVSLSEAHMQGMAQFVCILRDITERKESEMQLNRLANYDSLTGLPNRGLFHDRLSRALVRADRNRTMVALMFLDLDRFKTINDTLGHDAGDRLLKYVASVLSSVLRVDDTISFSGSREPAAHENGSPVARLGTDGTHVPRDDMTISRLGGDEFTVILEGITRPEHIGPIAEKILEGFKQPLKLGDEEIRVSTSIGIAVYPADADDKDSLIKCADHAMYRAKENGRGGFEFFAKDVNEIVDDRLKLEIDLRNAIEFNEFTLYYQPIVDIATGAVSGAEALIRWNQGEQGMVYPERFIPLLEEIGLIVPLGEWVLRTASRQYLQWQSQGMEPQRLSINLTTRQFRQMNLVNRIAGILKETGMEPGRLELDVTENTLMDQLGHSDQTGHHIAALSKLKKMGVRIAMDDFGTGYSSLKNLMQFPVNSLKIDASFVKDILANPAAMSVVSTIISMGREFSLNIVAEGVETQGQLEALRSLGCHQAQGILLGEPMSADLFGDYLSRHRAV